MPTYEQLRLMFCARLFHRINEARGNGFTVEIWSDGKRSIAVFRYFTGEGLEIGYDLFTPAENPLSVF